MIATSNAKADMKTQRTTLAEFIQQHRITATVERRDSNPNFADDSHMTRHFSVKLNMNGRRFTAPFSQGSAHTEEPTAADLLSCLAMDSAGIENARSFEEWAQEYGYDTDSRKAEKTYKVCVRQSEKLKNFLGEDAYQQLLWNTEQE